MPYKHYSTKAIGQSLINLYCYAYQTSYDYSKVTTICYQTLSNWMAHFENNIVNLLSPEAVVKLAINNQLNKNAEWLLQYYADEYCIQLSLEPESTNIFRVIQEKLTCREPLMGFFRPLLEPAY